MNLSVCSNFNVTPYERGVVSFKLVLISLLKKIVLGPLQEAAADCQCVFELGKNGKLCQWSSGSLDIHRTLVPASLFLSVQDDEGLDTSSTVDDHTLIGAIGLIRGSCTKPENY